MPTDTLTPAKAISPAVCGETEDIVAKDFVFLLDGSGSTANRGWFERMTHVVDEVSTCFDAINLVYLFASQSFQPLRNDNLCVLLAIVGICCCHIMLCICIARNRSRAPL
jgi:hypothetical protein